MCGIFSNLNVLQTANTTAIPFEHYVHLRFQSVNINLWQILTREYKYFSKMFRKFKERLLWSKKEFLVNMYLKKLCFRDIIQGVEEKIKK